MFRGLLEKYGKSGLKYDVLCERGNGKEREGWRAGIAAWRKLQEQMCHQQRRGKVVVTPKCKEKEVDATAVLRPCLIAVRSLPDGFSSSCATGPVTHAAGVPLRETTGYMMVHLQPSCAGGAYGSSALDTVPQTDGIR